VKTGEKQCGDKRIDSAETGERQFGERAGGPAGPLRKKEKRKKVKMAKFLELGLIEK
jgi:hypothetical protein